MNLSHNAFATSSDQRTRSSKAAGAAGAAAAAEAAAIAASLGGQPCAIGTGFDGSFTLHREHSSSALAAHSVQPPHHATPESMKLNSDTRDFYEYAPESDIASAPPPLPRLSAPCIQRRLQQVPQATVPVPAAAENFFAAATEMTYEDRASANSSRQHSLVAPSSKAASMFGPAEPFVPPPLPPMGLMNLSHEASFQRSAEGSPRALPGKVQLFSGRTAAALTEIQNIRSNCGLPSDRVVRSLSVGNLASMPHLLEAEKQSRLIGTPLTPRSRTPLAGWRPPVPTTQPNSYAWPPPPLPPVADDLNERLARLEARKIANSDAIREQCLEQLREDLQLGRAKAAQGKALEAQIEQCNADWREKFCSLEARFKQEECASAARLEDAMREAGKAQEVIKQLRSSLEEAMRESGKSQEVIRQLHEELQRAKHDGADALEEVRRKSQEDMEKLLREVQAATDSERRAREEMKRNDAEVRKLRNELELQQQVNHKSTMQLQKLQQQSLEQEEELKREKDSARQRGSAPQIELNQVRTEAEELRMCLKKVTEHRDPLDSDLQQLKMASREKDEECKLRGSYNEEKDRTSLLQSGLQSRQPERMAATRAQIDSNAITLARSIDSAGPSSPMSSVERVRQEDHDRFPFGDENSARASQVINVDLTEDNDDAPISKEYASGISYTIADRKEFSTTIETWHTTVEVDVRDDGY